MGENERRTLGTLRDQSDRRGRSRLAKRASHSPNCSSSSSILGIVSRLCWHLRSWCQAGRRPRRANRLSQSHDAQIASAYLATDVQSSKQLTPGATCAPSSPLTGQVNLINFSYDGGHADHVVLLREAGDETQVVRTFCSGGVLQAEAPIVNFAGAATEGLLSHDPGPRGALRPQ